MTVPPELVPQLLPPRRSVLRAGSLAIPGMSLASLFNPPVRAESTGRCFGSAKNIIFLYLAGGPPQHETFDPKPDAPREIRGPFSPISTNIPGIQFSELLPRTARMADRIAVIRSMATDDNIHSSSGSWVLTGYKYRGANARKISETDWPYFGSLLKRLRPSDSLPALSTVWLPDVMRLNENVTPAGQTAGFMGAQWNPEVFVGDPAARQYEIESLRATDISAPRMNLRHDLLAQLDRRPGLQNQSFHVFDTFQQQAFDLLTSGRARSAFDITREPDSVRDRYGRNRWGQSVLLARRLIESGVRLVHVQWPREPGDNAVDNPLWDTHARNADRVEDVLCPMFDVGYTALLEDLDERGLLDETLVVAIGEFGRTPKINVKGGRDHWGSVFSCALAGGGISGGQVFGSSDKDGAFPNSNRMEPGDLTATMFHLAGLDHAGTFPDRLGREQQLTPGEPVWKLLGESPATAARVEVEGSLLRVPPYDPDRHLAQTDFTAGLSPSTAPSRPRGWRGLPLLTSRRDRFGIRVSRIRPDRPCVEMGLHAGESRIEKGVSALLVQEVRSPFAGTYTLRVRQRLECSNSAMQIIFLRRLRCQIQFLRFQDQQKLIDKATVLAESDFVPAVNWDSVELTRQFLNPAPGANFSFGSGLAIAVRVTCGDTPSEVFSDDDFARVALDEVHLNFSGKEINDKVTV